MSASLVPSARSSSISLPARTSLTPREAEPFERVMDRLALRVEHAGLEGDEDARFHGSPRCFAGLFLPMRAPMAVGLWRGKLYDPFTIREHPVAGGKQRA